MILLVPSEPHVILSAARASARSAVDASPAVGHPAERGDSYGERTEGSRPARESPPEATP